MNLMSPTEYKSYIFLLVEGLGDKTMAILIEEAHK